MRLGWDVNTCTFLCSWDFFGFPRDFLWISFGFLLIYGIYGRRHGMTCLGTALAWRWLGIGLALSRHVYASDCYFYISWVVHACQFLGLFRLLMCLAMAIFGMLHVCCMIVGRRCEWRLLYVLSSQHPPGTIATSEVVCDVQVRVQFSARHSCRAWKLCV